MSQATKCRSRLIPLKLAIGPGTWIECQFLCHFSLSFVLKTSIRRCDTLSIQQSPSTPKSVASPGASEPGTSIAPRHLNWSKLGLKDARIGFLAVPSFAPVPRIQMLSGWWLFATPLKNDGVSNSWDYDIPIYWNIKFMFQTTNQWLLTINHH